MAVGPLLRAAMQRLAQDPNFRKYVANTATRIRQAPQVAKAERDVRSAVQSLKTKFTSSTASSKPASATGQQQHQQQQQQKIGTPFQRAQFFWGRNKEKVIAFVSVNFMGILFALQFGSQIWHVIVQYFSSPSQKQISHRSNHPTNNNNGSNNNSNKTDEQPQQQTRKQSKRKQAADAAAATSASQSGTLDLSLDGEGQRSSHTSNDYAQQFAESFQYKLDGGEFLPSLQSNGVTGSAPRVATSSWFGTASTQSSEMVFDLRR